MTNTSSNKLSNRQLTNAVEIVNLYLKYRNSFNYGHQKFIIWRNLIKFITGISDTKIIRKIFYHLLNKKQFHKYKKINSTYYIYNPTNKKLIIKDKVYFD